MSRKWKTSKKKRTNYVYYTVGGQAITIKPNEEGATDAIIATLHEWDDEELDAGRREDYHAPVHLDAYYDNNGDSVADRNSYLIDATANPLESLILALDEEEYEGKLDRLQSAVKGLEPKDQELINKVFNENRTRVSIAKERGVSETTIRKHLKRIYKELSKQI